MWPEAPPSTRGFHPTSIELHLFVPAEDGTYRSTLQEDDGITFAANGGACFRTTFVLTRASDQLTLRADVEGNGYPEFARQQFEVIVHGAVADTLLVDGAERTFDGQPIVIRSDGDGFMLQLGVPST
jgi:alpha-glucosidase